jgi:hypothetical protein
MRGAGVSCAIPATPPSTALQAAVTLSRSPRRWFVIRAAGRAWSANSLLFFEVAKRTTVSGYGCEAAPAKVAMLHCIHLFGPYQSALDSIADNRFSIDSRFIDVAEWPYERNTGEFYRR